MERGRHDTVRSQAAKAFAGKDPVMGKGILRRSAFRGAKRVAANATKGMSAFSELGMVGFAPRQYQGTGRHGDMERIGADMRRAFVTFNQNTQKPQ